MLISKELICLDLETKSKSEVINHLINKADQLGKLIDKSSFKDAVDKRELEYTTALGYDVAIPHGQDMGVKEPFVVFGRTLDTIEWDEHEVRIVFLIGVPFENRERVHLKILAGLSRHLMEDEFRLSLMNAKDVEEVFNILEKVEKEVNL